MAIPVSTVPAVLNALHAMFAAAAPGVAVSLGPLPGSDIPADYVCVGWASDNLPSVVGSSRASDLGNYGDQAAEQYAVWCCVSTSSGDEAGAARLAATDTIFRPLVAAVRTDRTLTGALIPPGYADLGTYQWHIEEGGQVATVMFQVAVDVGWVV